MGFQGFFFFVTVATVKRVCSILTNEFAEYEDRHFCLLILWLCPLQLVHHFVHYFVCVHFLYPWSRKEIILLLIFIEWNRNLPFYQIALVSTISSEQIFKKYCWKAFFCMKNAVNASQNLEGVILPLLLENSAASLWKGNLKCDSVLSFHHMLPAIFILRTLHLMILSQW